MFRKLFAALGAGVVSVSAAVAAPPYSPYSNEGIDFIYNLLFCDDISAFQPKPGEKPTSWQATLFSEPPDIAALETLAAEVSQDGRIRSVAYQQLRSAGRKVPVKILLGVIVEVPLAEGLDTLAAYSEGGVRYINKAGKLGQARPELDHLPGLGCSVFWRGAYGANAARSSGCTGHSECHPIAAAGR